MQLDVVIRNKEGLKLIGTLNKPPSALQTPIVILCHGFAANKELHFFPELARRLEKEGITTLRFDCRACGKSEGEIHPTHKTMVEDLNAAINYAKKQGHTSIGLAGHSMGGTSVIQASQEEGIDAIVTYGAVAYPARNAEKKRNNFVKQTNGTYTFTSPLQETFTLTENWFVDAKEIEPIETIRKTQAAKLIIHGTADDRINQEEAQALYEAAKQPKKIHLLAGTGHFYKGHYEEIINETIKHFTNYLQGLESEEREEE